MKWLGRDICVKMNRAVQQSNYQSEFPLWGSRGLCCVGYNYVDGRTSKFR
jgi:hypothetical protein